MLLASIAAELLFTTVLHGRRSYSAAQDFKPVYIQLSTNFVFHNFGSSVEFRSCCCYSGTGKYHWMEKPRSSR